MKFEEIKQIIEKSTQFHRALSIIATDYLWRPDVYDDSRYFESIYSALLAYGFVYNPYVFDDIANWIINSKQYGHYIFNPPYSSMASFNEAQEQFYSKS